jgi:hypothetical protein
MGLILAFNDLGNFLEEADARNLVEIRFDPIGFSRGGTTVYRLTALDGPMILACRVTASSDRMAEIKEDLEGDGWAVLPGRWTWADANG